MQFFCLTFKMQCTEEREAGKVKTWTKRKKEKKKKKK